MTKKIYLMLLSIFLSITYLSAQVVQKVNVPQAGGLATAIGNNLKTVTNLTLTGTINAADFQTIKQMTALKNLDMSKVNVVEKAIPNNAFENRVLNSLTLPEGLETIGGAAFQYSKIASTVVLPSTLKTIAAWAFDGSTTPIDLNKTKKSLEKVYEVAFSNYQGLKTLDFSDFPTTLKFQGVAYHGTFKDYTGHVILPRGIDNIPAYVFWGFKGSVDIPASVKTLKDYSFSRAEMKELILPEGLETIGGAAFQYSKIASTIVLPSTLKTIAAWAFDGSTTPIDLNKTKKSLEKVYEVAFSNYQGLKTLDFSDFPTTLQFQGVAYHGTFKDYTGHVILPRGIDNIPAYVFWGFKGSVDIPASVKTLKDYSFSRAEMKELILPEGLETIGGAAFQYSKIASTVVLPSTLKTIAAWAFDGSTTPIDLNKTKKSLEKVYEVAFSNYQGLKTLDFSDFPTTLKFQGVAYHGTFKDYTGHVILPRGIDNIPAYVFWGFKGSVDIPASVKTLKDYSFSRAEMKELILPEGLETIGGAAFQYSKIASTVVLPSTLKTIAAWAFDGSTTPIDLNKTKKSLEKVYEVAFSNYQGLKTLDFSDFPTTLKFQGVAYHGTFKDYTGHVILPRGIDNIPAYVFWGFKGSVDIPASVKTLKDYSFSRAEMKELILPEGLETIGGAAFQYSKIASTIVLPSTLKTIAAWAFDGSTTPIDLNKTKKSLEKVYEVAFSNYQGLKTLDFSDFPTTLKFQGVAYHGTFKDYTGHVILPRGIDNIPAYVFWGFKGSVDIPASVKTLKDYSFSRAEMKELILPEGLETIGGAAFQYSKIASTVVLPSTLKTIAAWAFDGSTTPIDLNKTKKSLEKVYEVAFSNYQGLKTLDFSDFPTTLKFQGVAYHGTFKDYTGHVILPRGIDNIPAYVFWGFKGSVDIPQGLKTISNNAFENSTITSIELPSSVTTIGSNAFYNTTKLEKIISHNPTPPTLGSNVFTGVNKETTVLEVPKESLRLYGTASQWKDFLNISGRVPSKLDLTYKITSKVWPAEFSETHNLEIPYEAVRIGEYYWMNKNFNHQEPNRQRYSANTESLIAGFENKYPLTQATLDKYLSQMQVPDKTQFQVDIEQFTKDFGYYYSFDTRNFMSKWGRIYENNSTNNNSGWNLPYNRDYRQLIAMSPFNWGYSFPELDVHDAMIALGAKATDNRMASIKIIGACGGDWSYWSAYGKNIYGFGLMPSGDRLNGDGSWGTEICGDKTSKYGSKGDIKQVYHRAQLVTKDGYISFHEVIDSGIIGWDYHWLPMRWCRVLTDDELGYKLYIKIDNIDKNSREWISLTQEDEIPLLNYMRNNNIPTDQTSIIKLRLNETAPNGYIELPHGYIRGFYVQYLLDIPNSNLKVSDIMQYAYGVRDEVLQYRENVGRPTSGTTKSLVSDEVVVPFKTDASVTLYPNPVQDVLNISGDNVEKVTIYDMSGRQVAISKNTNTVSVSDLKSGSYIVRVLTAKGESTHKVMKK